MYIGPNLLGLRGAESKMTAALKGLSMTRNIRVFGLALIAASCALALAQDALTLKMTPKVGDTYKFKLTAKMSMSGMDAELVGHLTDKVVEVAPSGEYLIESSQTDTVVKAMDQEIPLPSETVKSRYAANGDLLDLQTENPGPEKWRLAQLTGFTYPTTAVKVGDEWTSTIKADPKTGVLAAKRTYKVEAFEKVGDHDTAKIKGTYTETEGSTPASADGHIWIDTKDGSVVKTESTWTNVPVGPGGAAANGTVTMERE